MTKPDIVEIAKRRGFFWQSSYIHSPIAGFYDYGHIGTLLKRRWEDAWRSYFLGLDENFYEISTSVVMPENVFRASGHLENFVDPVVKCGKCGHTERADHVLEDLLKEKFEGIPAKRLDGLIKKHRIKCEKCGGTFGDAGELNMTFRVDVGTGKAMRRAYLKPETAQGAYVNFKQMFEVMRRRLPMGLAIIGRAFRNEISPRQGLVRMREFSQAELQVFFDPDNINKHPDFGSISGMKLLLLPEKRKIIEMSSTDAVRKLGLPEFYIYYLAKIQEFFLTVVCIPRERFRFKELSKEERAFYNKHHWDIEIETGSGWTEVGGLHYRSDHDLAGHEKVSGEAMSVSVGSKKFIPHVIEISMGIDRNVYAVLDVFYREEKERSVIGFPRHLAPFDAGLFPLVNRDSLPEKAKEVKDVLAKAGFSVFSDASGSIGRMYRRMDEIGTPAGITIDYESIKNNDVTLRDRDSMKQIRVEISTLPDVLRRFLGGEALEKLGSVIS